MKIAILTSEFITEKNNWHGGLANYLSRITAGLKNRGHEVHIFVYSDRHETVIYNGIILHRLCFDEKKLVIFNKLTLRLLPGFAQMIYTAYIFRREFIKVHKKENFDIIHSSSCLTPALFLNSRKIVVPIVTRMSSVMKYCQIAYGRRNKLDIYLINKAEEYLIKKSDKVFVPSQLIKNKIREEFDREIDLIESPEYFRESSDLDYYFYDKYLSNKKYILFYGTFGRLKGSEFISANIDYFLNEFEDYYFVIIGKMSILKKGVLPIEPLLEKAGMNKNRIIYCNSLPHRLLLPVVKKAVAVLLPSMIDNLPNTCIEAMSLGKIVIGTYDGGFEQLIENDFNGYLVKFGDNQALRNVWQLVCRGNQEELAKIGANAKKTVAQRLNFDIKIRELEEYYESAIKEFKSRFKTYA